MAIIIDDLKRLEDLEEVLSGLLQEKETLEKKIDALQQSTSEKERVVRENTISQTVTAKTQLLLAQEINSLVHWEEEKTNSLVLATKQAYTAFVESDALVRVLNDIMKEYGFGTVVAKVGSRYSNAKLDSIQKKSADEEDFVVEFDNYVEIDFSYDSILALTLADISEAVTKIDIN